MTLRDLTGEQLDRLIRDADRQFGYFSRAWRRCQANDIPLDDPLAIGICDVGAALKLWRDRLEQLKRQLPQHHRPLAKPTKNHGLREVEQPWAQQQRQAAEEVARHAERPSPPDPTALVGRGCPTANEPQV